MEIRFIIFAGPKRESAEISFGHGLNLIYGPSNTGKSSVLDGIDFMLGRKRPLKELPEHEGYDKILLGVEFANSEYFTFVRSIEGGDFECFEGLHRERPQSITPIILKEATDTKKNQSISSFILERVDLSNKKIKTNANNAVVSLTLRNSLDLAIINETNIQEESSPFISKQYTKITETKSRLKFMLTGVDDSALLPSEVEKKSLSRTAKLEMLMELIAEQTRLLDIVNPTNDLLVDLKEQSKKLADTILNQANTLDIKEEIYNRLISNRSDLRKKLDKQNERFNEVSEMLSRFTLLEQQYISDISRLENIAETGTLLEALPTDKCPACGVELYSEDIPKTDIKQITFAAISEKSKIERLHKELLITVNSLYSEIELINKKIPETTEQIDKIINELLILNPELTTQRTFYSTLVMKKSQVDKKIDQHEQLLGLTKKKEELEKETTKKETKNTDENERMLPTSALFKLSQSVKNLLQEWTLPNSGDVHFDKETGDFVIDGKHRISNGKGYRAITHAASKLGLMKYTYENNLAHIGFVILDSPLLAYEDPENSEDDLSGTDVNIKFFDSLSNWESKQIIIFENKKSIPAKYNSGKQIIEFTRQSFGRYGFFPST